MLDPIPAERHPAVAAALKRAFGTAQLDAPPVPLTGGMSGALLFRIRLGGIAYLLRLEAPGLPPFGDPVRAHACMRTAAAACLAPRVWVADPHSGVVVMDLVPERPLAEHPDREAMLVELAQAVRLLHETPAFPPLMDYLAGMDLVSGWFDSAGLSSPTARELLERFAAFRDRYRTPESDLVSSHNDLNRRNVLYDGRRLWLIDWDAAFLADRYVDMAALANGFTQGEEEVRLVLRTYLGAEPTAAQLARLFLMRQVNHLFYGLMFAISAATPGAPSAPADVEGASPLAHQHRRLATGSLDLWRAESRLDYGASLLAEALAGFRSEAFAGQLAIAA